MSPECCPTPAQNADPAPHPVPSTALPSAAEPTAARSERETTPGLVVELRARIEAADTHLMRMQHLAEIGESCIANMHPQRNAIEPCSRVLEQILERIEWARQTLISDLERESGSCTKAPPMMAPALSAEA